MSTSSSNVRARSSDPNACSPSYVTRHAQVHKYHRSVRQWCCWLLKPHLLSYYDNLGYFAAWHIYFLVGVGVMLHASYGASLGSTSSRAVMLATNTGNDAFSRIMRQNRARRRERDKETQRHVCPGFHRMYSRTAARSSILNLRYRCQTVLLKPHSSIRQSGILSITK